MSRNSKKVNKRITRESVVYVHDEKGVRRGRQKGPSKTEPSHGKRNQWPYDKSAPQRKPRGDS